MKFLTVCTGHWRHPYAGTNFVISCLICAEQVVNAHGSLAVLTSLASDYWVVDLKAKRFLHKLRFPRDATPDPDNLPVLGTTSLDDERLIHVLGKSHEEFRTKETILYPAIWDLSTGLLSFVSYGTLPCQSACSTCRRYLS